VIREEVETIPDEAETKRLRELEKQRARREAELAAATDSPDERHAHERRSDKADYLRKKLEDQSRAPDE
jgi:hypothetical protein